jgi:hypothetical protein
MSMPNATGSSPSTGLSKQRWLSQAKNSLTGDVNFAILKPERGESGDDEPGSCEESLTFRYLNSQWWFQEADLAISAFIPKLSDLKSVTAKPGGDKPRPYRSFAHSLGRGGVYPRPQRINGCWRTAARIAWIRFCLDGNI